MGERWEAFRQKRWEALYNELLDALAELGKNDAFGEGDFWLVDDDWGGQHQKLCVTKAEFWSSVVKDAIRNVLARSFGDWGVFVVFEDGSDRSGLVVYSDGVEVERRWA